MSPGITYGSGAWPNLAATLVGSGPSFCVNSLSRQPPWVQRTVTVIVNQPVLTGISCTPPQPEQSGSP